MELLLVLILISLIVINVKLSKISKAKEIPHSNALDEKISEKIKTSELLLGITYPNFKEIHDQIISNNIDIDYVKEDFNFNQRSIDGALYGEIEMFKALESDQLDRSSFANESLDGVANKLLLMFYDINYNKRKSLANDIFNK